MTFLTFVGLAAGCMTTISFVPQVFRVWHTRSTRDISLGMFGLMTGGVFLWLVYGILLNDLPIIVANAITLALATSILVAKRRFG